MAKGLAGPYDKSNPASTWQYQPRGGGPVPLNQPAMVAGPPSTYFNNAMPPSAYGVAASAGGTRGGGRGGGYNNMGRPTRGGGNIGNNTRGGGRGGSSGSGNNHQPSGYQSWR